MSRPQTQTTLHRFFFRIQLIALVLVVCVLAVYFIYSFDFVERQVLQSTETILSVLTDRIDRAASETRILAFNIAYNPDVQQSLLETDVLRLIQYSSTYYAIAEMTANSSELIDDVALCTPDLSVFRNLSEDISYIDYKSALSAHLEANRFEESQLVALDIQTGEEYLCLVLPVYSHAAGSEEESLLGYCLTSFLVDRSLTLFSEISVLEDSHAAFLDESGVAISSTLPPSEEMTSLVDVHEHPERYLINRRRLEGVNAELVAFVSKRDIYMNQIGFFVLSGLLVGILLLVNILFASRIKHAFARPIERLVARLDSIDSTDPKHRIGAMPPNEIGHIAGSINTMLDNVHEMNERNLAVRKRMSDLELHTKEAELLALQAQINPHFMYNTLECMRSIAIDYGSDEIVQISTSLAEILRYCLSPEFHVSLERELTIVERYLQILRQRFGDRYRFSIHADEGVRQAQIIKMTIQPIVENAVFHGLEKRRTGSLEITCSTESSAAGRRLVIRVRDDGRGMSSDQLDRLRSSLESADPMSEEVTSSETRRHERSLGLLNIDQRIKTFYCAEHTEAGQTEAGHAVPDCACADFGISIESDPGRGTEVVITVPLVMATDDVLVGEATSG